MVRALARVWVAYEGDPSHNLLSGPNLVEIFGSSDEGLILIQLKVFCMLISSTQESCGTSSEFRISD